VIEASIRSKEWTLRKRCMSEASQFSLQKMESSGQSSCGESAQTLGSVTGSSDCSSNARSRSYDTPTSEDSDNEADKGELDKATNGHLSEDGNNGIAA
jgi:hypothetical protein